MDGTGKCICGAVSFTIRDLKTEFTACHCKMCQRWAGSALLAFAVPPETVAFEGNHNIKTYKSSDWAERGWCDKCGSNIFYRVTAPGAYQGTHHMPVGLLDDAAGMTLVSEIFYDRRSPAFAFAGETKKLTEADVMAMFPAPPEGTAT